MKPQKIYSREITEEYTGRKLFLVEVTFWTELYWTGAYKDGGRKQRERRFYRISVQDLVENKAMGFMRSWNSDVPMRTFTHVLEVLLTNHSFDQIQEALNR